MFTHSTHIINWLAGLDILINDRFGRLDLLSRQRPFPRIVIRPIEVILQAFQREMGVEVQAYWALEAKYQCVR
jgi:hypothetical protein